jgi:hypothetical protein
VTRLGCPRARLACLGLVAVSLFAADRAAAEPRRFDFARDTFSFTNDLYWSYDAPPRDGPVRFGQRCVNVVRSARQFFHAARFGAGEPLTEAEYRKRVRAVLASDPRADAPAAAPVLFPGFADLRSFSHAHERLLKEELGGSSASYLQRGNWRMVLPFSRGSQRSAAAALQERLARGGLPIARVVNFPVIDVNHALLVFDADARADEIRFRAYDPNDVTHPVELILDRSSSSFRLPRTAYFAGGPVNVYEIFTGPLF